MLMVLVIAPTCSSLEILGSITDTVTLNGASSVAVSGNRAYVTSFKSGQPYGKDGELVVLDVSDRTSPSILNSMSYNDGFAGFYDDSYLLSVVLHNGYAYVSTVRRCAAPFAMMDPHGLHGSRLTALTSQNMPSVCAVEISTVSASVAPSLYGGSWSSACARESSYLNFQDGQLYLDAPNDRIYASASRAIVGFTATTGSPKPTLHGYHWPWSGFYRDSRFTMIGSVLYALSAYEKRLNTMGTVSLPYTRDNSIYDTTELPSPKGIAAKGTHLFVADSARAGGALVVLDASSDPVNPSFTAVNTDASLNQANEIVISGEFAYVATSAGTVSAAARTTDASSLPCARAAHRPRVPASRAHDAVVRSSVSSSAAPPAALTTLLRVPLPERVLPLVVCHPRTVGGGGYFDTIGPHCHEDTQRCKDGGRRRPDHHWHARLCGR